MTLSVTVRILKVVKQAFLNELFCEQIMIEVYKILYSSVTKKKKTVPYIFNDQNGHCQL